MADNLERYIDALGVILGEEAIRVMTDIDKPRGDVRIWGTQEVIALPGRNRTNTGRGGDAGYVRGRSARECPAGMLG